MASRKITEYTALTTPANDDVLQDAIDAAATPDDIKAALGIS